MSVTTVELDATTVLPEGYTQEDMEGIFEKIDALGEVGALAVLMFVPEFTDVDIPGPAEVATVQDALKALALADPTAVLGATITAAITLADLV